MTVLKHYDILVAPHVTEKSTDLSQQNKVVFKVANGASKPEIKAAVEALFNVKVAAVNTINVAGKRKIFRGQRGTRSDMKKAIVTLAEGQSLDMSQGV